MIALSHVVAWKPRVDPVRRVIPSYLKLAILTRGWAFVPADRMNYFLDVARREGATWPDHLSGPLTEIGSTFPVTVELFFRQRDSMTAAEIKDAFAGYLALRMRAQLGPSCFRLIFNAISAAERKQLQATLNLDIGALFRRANVRLSEVDRRGDRWLLLAYVCFPPVLQRLIRTDPVVTAISPLVHAMPPLSALLKPNYHLRDAAGKSAASLGVPISSCRAIVSEKKQVDGDVWYHVELTEQANFSLKPVSDSKEILPLQLPPLEAGQKGWVVSDAVDILVAPWELFRHDLQEFEASKAAESLERKITFLRRILTRSDLPFDVVIGTERKGPYLDDLPYRNDAWQLARDYQAVVAPDGRWMDIQHLAVGLDALQHVEHPSHFAGMYIGTSWDASTWGGDVGAAAADATLHEANLTWEFWNRTATEAERLMYYFESRAPLHDRLGNIDGWGVNAVREKNPSITTIDELVEIYYSQLIAGSERTLIAGRADALTRFLAHYGFDFDAARDYSRFPSLVNQKEARERIRYGVGAFAGIWMIRQLSKDKYMVFFHKLPSPRLTGRDPELPPAPALFGRDDHSVPLLA